MTDAIAALTHLSDDAHKKLYAKAYFRAASASYRLKIYEKAVLFLRNQLELCPDDSDAVLLLGHTQDLLREQREVCYNIAKTQGSLSHEPRVDAADYIMNTTIRPSGIKRGRGLFATCNLNPGDLIMAETSFCCVWRREDANLLALECNASSPDEVLPSFVGLWRAAVNEAGRNPLEGSDLMRLQGNYKGSTGTQIDGVDGTAVVDAFKVHDIVTCNSFTLSSINPTNADSHGSLAEGSSALWIRLSYANHSCIPNARKISYGDLALVHATRPIAEGEEIVFNYLGDCKDFEVATKVMTSQRGFYCECLLCKADIQCPPADPIARNRLYKETLIQSAANSPREEGSLSMLPRCERYVEEINSTYSNNLYVDLPRVRLLHAQAWLLGAYITARDRPRSCQATIHMLQTLGFEVDTNGETITKISATANSIFSEVAMVLLHPIVGQAVEAQCYRHATVARHLLGFVKLLERVNHGTNFQVLQAYKHHMSDLLGSSAAVVEKGIVELGL